MGQLRKDTQQPRIQHTAWCWVWLHGDRLPIHQTAVQGFIVAHQRREMHDAHGPYSEHWYQVLVLGQDWTEPWVLWVPEHQIQRVGDNWEPPLHPSWRTPLFDSVAERRRRAAEDRRLRR